MTKTTPTRYSPLMVTLHWLTFLLILAEFILGETTSRIPNDTVAKLTPLAIHMLLGITILLVIITRFVVRMRTPQPAYVSTGSAFLDGLGKCVHYALYLFVFLMALSGLTLSAQAGLPQIVFGGVGSLPSDFYIFPPRLVHEFIAPVLFLLFLLHVGAAFYHQWFLKDKLFSRMWFGK
ncbi:MAG: cytochrome b [Anaerolineae bacterium]|nr:cytochrome b [Anaerolineae bacterium]